MSQLEVIACGCELPLLRLQAIHTFFQYPHGRRGQACCQIGWKPRKFDVNVSFKASQLPVRQGRKEPEEKPKAAAKQYHPQKDRYRDLSPQPTGGFAGVQP